MIATLSVCSCEVPQFEQKRTTLDAKLYPQRMTEYPNGLRIGDQIGSQAGEFLRYAIVSETVPTENEQYETLRLGADLRCDVCNTIVRNLMQRAESHSEDHIMDQLEGVPSKLPEITNDVQENRVNKARRGCNKHFKDEVLLKGYFVWRCSASKPADEPNQPDNPGPPVAPADFAKPKMAEADDGMFGGRAADNVISDSQLAAAAPLHLAIATEPQGAEEDLPWHGTREWCLAGPIPGHTTEEQANTYDRDHEGIYHACEHTIGRYGDDLGRFLAEKLEGGYPLSETIQEGCREIAHCEEYRIRKSGTGSRNTLRDPRPGDSRKTPEKKMEKKPAKQKKADNDEEKSYLQLLEEDEDIAKKDKRRRRKTNKGTVPEKRGSGYFNVFDEAQDGTGRDQRKRRRKTKDRTEI